MGRLTKDWSAFFVTIFGLAFSLSIFGLLTQLKDELRPLLAVLVISAVCFGFNWGRITYDAESKTAKKDGGVI